MCSELISYHHLITNRKLTISAGGVPWVARDLMQWPVAVQGSGAFDVVVQSIVRSFPDDIVTDYRHPEQRFYRRSAEPQRANSTGWTVSTIIKVSRDVRLLIRMTE